MADKNLLPVASKQQQQSDPCLQESQEEEAFRIANTFISGEPYKRPQLQRKSGSCPDIPDPEEFLEKQFSALCYRPSQGSQSQHQLKAKDSENPGETGQATGNAPGGSVDGVPTQPSAPLSVPTTPLPDGSVKLPDARPTVVISPRSSGAVGFLGTTLHDTVQVASDERGKSCVTYRPLSPSNRGGGGAWRGSRTAPPADFGSPPEETSGNGGPVRAKSHSPVLEPFQPVPLQQLEDAEIVDAENHCVKPECWSAQLEALVPRDQEGNLTSWGSRAHTHMRCPCSGEGEKEGDEEELEREPTCRPCVFAHTRGCRNGTRCLFCHFKHAPRKRVRVSKKKRAEARLAKQLALAAGDLTPAVSPLAGGAAAAGAAMAAAAAAVASSGAVSVYSGEGEAESEQPRRESTSIRGKSAPPSERPHAEGRKAANVTISVPSSTATGGPPRVLAGLALDELKLEAQRTAQARMAASAGLPESPMSAAGGGVGVAGAEGGDPREQEQENRRGSEKFGITPEMLQALAVALPPEGMQREGGSQKEMERERERLNFFRRAQAATYASALAHSPSPGLSPSAPASPLKGPGGESFFLGGAHPQTLHLPMDSSMQQQFSRGDLSPSLFISHPPGFTPAASTQVDPQMGPGEFFIPAASGSGFHNSSFLGAPFAPHGGVSSQLDSSAFQVSLPLLSPPLSASSGTVGTADAFQGQSVLALPTMPPHSPHNAAARNMSGPGLLTVGHGLHGASPAVLSPAHVHQAAQMAGLISSVLGSPIAATPYFLGGHQGHRTTSLPPARDEAGEGSGGTEPRAPAFPPAEGEGLNEEETQAKAPEDTRERERAQETRQGRAGGGRGDH
uniref:C3H1-type domain-containing protein n=1 Tax=Chromera velia CCMP2878 TaxID=1169474 RepID=A0A0G4FHG2_9ALVE|eukprot:Cvel_17047.t1-p1 / transcript=Cvel_17047.t1 / gene=Cvel_17047 / organism=Chromera_velia_CCMP2878 / gene_product=hypothetical protein / transcript_product=hypothetical protein / location=Cvel_scaffold1342:16469-19890(+) / protein_length=846 / sequence_SO=supercontig / SO=protein_coding / is_pseudo=false